MWIINEEDANGTPTYIEVIPCLECQHMNVMTKCGVTMKQCSQTGRKVQDSDFCSMARIKKQI